MFKLLAFGLVSALAFFSGPVDAAFSQGNLQYTRDYYMQVPSKFTSTLAFCQNFRSACVNYAGSRGEHHQLDCVTSQSLPYVYAWCGGLKKNANGSWDSSSGVTTDLTRPVAANVGAGIKRKPTTYQKCLAYQKVKPEVVCKENDTYASL